MCSCEGPIRSLGKSTSSSVRYAADSSEDSSIPAKEKAENHYQFHEFVEK